MADPSEKPEMITSAVAGLGVAVGSALWEAEKSGDLTTEQVNAISQRADELFNAMLNGQIIEKGEKAFIIHPLPKPVDDPKNLIIGGQPQTDLDPPDVPEDIRAHYYSGA